MVAMVDVGDKPNTDRFAVARGRVAMSRDTVATIRDGNLKKGDILASARIAGIMGAKRTSELIPLCHPVALSNVSVHLTLIDEPPCVEIEATARTFGKTGVEMEALTAVAVAALTIYDMAKAVQRDMRIEDVRLVTKRGGRSGDITLE